MKKLLYIFAALVAVAAIASCNKENPQPSVKKLTVVSSDLNFNSSGGSGTIVGFTSIKNTLTKGYRYYNIEFVPSDSDFDGTGVDQPDCDGTNWAVGTTPGTGKTYQCPYHGTAAASTATVSSVARDIIGWDASVWDFSADLPTLK